MLEVLCAPDWRVGCPYQELLARALSRHGVNVNFIEGYKRIFPLRRLMATRRCDVLHLHWPEAYYPSKDDGFDWFRYARFPFDLAGAVNRCVLVTTAHNLGVHNRAKDAALNRNTRQVHAAASIVFAHSELAKQRIVEVFGVPPERVRVIPHGDLSVVLDEPLPASTARGELGLDCDKLAVVFGAVEPYKGLEEIIEWWHQAKPDIKLVIVGKPMTPAYGLQILQQIGNATNIIHHLERVPDELLRLWLSAADVTIFNYREVFTSGAATLARSFGVPIVLPRRLDTVVLDEPTPYVHRFTDFATDFEQQLVGALAVPSDFAAAASWREACNWDKVACLTADGYRYALG
jgi:glycosyltransferase involved in cell wall biosynthesis